MVAVRRQDLDEEEAVELVSLLLQQPGIKVNLTDKRGLTALHLAKSAACVRLLLAVPDIDLEAKANLEMATPLMAAIWRGALQSVMELVTTPGIDLEAKDSRGRSLEDWASGRNEILEVLRHARQLEVIDWRLDGKVNSQREVEVIDLDETDGGDGQEVETDGGDEGKVEVVSKDPECNPVRFASYRPRAS